MDQRAVDLIARLELKPHPEGGYYREVFRSIEHVLPQDGRGQRASLTTIFFLLVDGMVSRWHRVDSDEVWHLYEGGPLELLELDASGMSLTRHLLSPMSDGAGVPVHTVAARRWQAARPLAAYVLVGCTVAPGFQFDDFRMLADDPDLARTVQATFPDVADLV